MSFAFVLVTGLAAAVNIAAGIIDFARAQWVLDNMTKYGVPHSWLFGLGAVKTAGGVGLLAGLAVPPLGIAAATGLALYFVAALGTVVRARWFSHVPAPGAFLVLALGALAVGLAEL
ncbi:hypothetical protein BJF78_25335 [Pseudonocardia sp. CNS-139]|nr:hypothetical protein BJF78_25335 [Pseudonocardia sp. CNS-139]